MAQQVSTFKKLLSSPKAMSVGMSLWPPYLAAGVRVEEISSDYTYARVRHHVKIIPQIFYPFEELRAGPLEGGDRFVLFLLLEQFCRRGRACYRSRQLGLSICCHRCTHDGRTNSKEIEKVTLNRVSGDWSWSRMGRGWRRNGRCSGFRAERPVHLRHRAMGNKACTRPQHATYLLSPQYSMFWPGID